MARSSTSHLLAWANVARLREIALCRRETTQWLALTLAYLRIRPLRFPYEVRLRSGQRIVLNERTDLVIFWLVYVRQHYPVYPSDRVVVDVGANIGIFTLYAARQAPGARIIALEPFPETRQRLARLIERNGLINSVTILDCALSGTSGTISMDKAAGIPSQYRRTYSEATKTLNLKHRGPAGLQQEEDGIIVRKVTLDEMLNEANIAAADLMKMNIHGTEYEVILSTAPAVLQRCARIALQYHDMPSALKLTKYSIFEHLSAAGFTLKVDDDTGRGAGRAILELNAIPT